MRATDQQRDQLNTCTRAADRVRSQSLDMQRVSKSKDFSPDRARQKYNPLRDEVRALQQQHEQFAKGLTEEQRARLEEHIRSIDQSRERLQPGLQEMDRELGQPVPDRQRLTEQAKEIEREAKTWQKQNRTVGSEMGVSP